MTGQRFGYCILHAEPGNYPEETDIGLDKPRYCVDSWRGLLSASGLVVENR